MILPMTTEPVALDADDAAFLEGGVSIIAAARDDRNETTLSRAIGCRVSADRRRVTIFLSAAQSAELLADLRANGVIAVVFSQPTSHRTIQLKGIDAAIVPLQADDPHLWAAYRERMAAEVQPIGFSETFVRTMLNAPAGDVVAVAFTPSAAFLQTPGPKAGTPLHTRL
jgi:hypothetical protein